MGRDADHGGVDVELDREHDVEGALARHRLVDRLAAEVEGPLVRLAHAQRLLLPLRGRLALHVRLRPRS